MPQDDFPAPQVVRDVNVDSWKKAAGLAAAAVGIAGWLLFALRSIIAVGSYAFGPPADSVYLYDWRVHYAGALDLVERDLYLDGAIGVGSRQMPVDVFNLPPAAAAVAVPPAALGYELGGLLWVIAGVLAVVVAAWWATRVLALRHGLVIVGLLLLLLVTQPFFDRVTVLGNSNALMLPILVGFVWAHMTRRERTSGLLLGLAIALKVWPVALLVLLLRDRRWQSLAWCVGLLAAQAVLFLAWLGTGVIGPMVDALRTPVPIPDGVAVLWTSWAREVFDWWPALGSVAVAAALLAIPARGRLGLGLGFLAGLSLIANIWDHYLPALALAWLLILTSPEASELAGRVREWLRPAPQPSAAGTSR